MIAATLPYVHIDSRRVKILGTTGWDYPAAPGERALVGGWFAAPDPGAWRAFAGTFAKSTGSAPPRLASLAYDAVALSATFATGSGRYGPVNLTRASGFNGVDGNYRFLADGTSERSLAVLELRQSGPILLEPAPQGFDLKPSAVGPRRPKGPPKVAVGPSPPAPAPQTPPAPGSGSPGVIIINE